MKYLVAFTSLFTFAAIAYAAPIDIPSDAWYSTTVSEFGRAGYFDETQPFRPTQMATRAEFVQLVVKLQGGVKHAPFTTQSFDDVSPSNSFFDYFEEAGLAGWLKGTGSCYGTHPCTASPDSPINRAEASALMIRAFGLQTSEQAPSFNDNPSGQWFSDSIKAVASRCVLQGDAGGKRVRPSDSMIRAEMVKMLERVLQNLSYPNCSTNTDFTLPSLALPRPIIDPTSSFSSSSSVSNFRPNCKNASEVVWDCSEWSVCTHSSDGWNQTRSCKISDVSKCISSVMSPNNQTCTPSASQESYYNQQQKEQQQRLQEETNKQQQALQLLQNKAKTITNYNTMKQNQMNMDSQLPYFSGTTSTQLFQLSSQYSTQVALMKVYFDKANSNSLQPSDNTVANLIVQSANALLDRFDAIAGTELNIMQRQQQLQQQQDYQYRLKQIEQQNSLNRQVEQQQKVYCDELTARSALNGSFGSSAVSYQLFQAGCISVQQYCNGLSFQGGSLPAECQ